MHIFKLRLAAYSIIFLSGDISINPGPKMNIPSVVRNEFEFPSKRGLQISHLNVRSIIYKMDSIQLMLKDKRFDVFSYLRLGLIVTFLTVNWQLRVIHLLGKIELTEKEGVVWCMFGKIFHIVYDLICWIKALNLALLK